MSPVRKVAPGAYGPIGGGPEITKYARELMIKCGQWPFPWSFAPPGSEALSMRGTIALPAFDTQTQVCSFNVPVGKLGYLDSIMLTLDDPNYREGLGFATFAILVNQPAGATFAIGRPAQGYGQITTQMPIGPVKFPIKLPYGVLLGSDDTLYIHITIPSVTASGVANPLGPGFPNTTTCWGLGWIWPAPK